MGPGFRNNYGSAGRDARSKLFYLRNVITSAKCISGNDFTAPIGSGGEVLWVVSESPSGHYIDSEWARSAARGCCGGKAAEEISCKIEAN